VTDRSDDTSTPARADDASGSTRADGASGSTRADGGTARPSEATGSRPASRSGNTFFGDVWVNFKRWNLKAIRNPFVLVVSLAQPIIFLVLFTEVFGNVAGDAVSRGIPGITYETYLVPAIAIQVSLAAAVTSGIGLVNDIEEGMFEKILVSPMNRTAVFVGKTAAEVFRIAIQVSIILGLGVLLGAEVALGVVGALGIVGVGILFSLWFVALSNSIAVLTKDQESTIIAANLLQFPLLFLSSAFLPLETLPGWIQTFAKLNPVTYGVDAARSLMLDRDVMTVIEISWFGGTLDGVVPGVAVLLAIDLALGAVAVSLLSSATSSKVQ
jgi:ABC-2 type transport system permease protein